MSRPSLSTKARLVFTQKQRTVLTVDQTWYRNLFRRRQAQPPETIETKADHGDADAQFLLGQRFDQQRGNTADEVQAVTWYRRAAIQQHPPAQFRLGMMLAIGRGAALDDAEARRWIVSAATLGHIDAQFELGVRHRRASFEGTAQHTADSNVEAYRWFRLAAAQGHSSSAAELENLTLRMTREQIVEGDRRADCFALHPPDLVRDSTPRGALPIGATRNGSASPEG